MDRTDKPSMLKRIIAIAILIIAAIIAIKLIVGLLSAIFWVILAVVVVAAIIWAWRVIF